MGLSISRMAAALGIVFLLNSNVFAADIFDEIKVTLGDWTYFSSDRPNRINQGSSYKYFIIDKKEFETLKAVGEEKISESTKDVSISECVPGKNTDTYGIDTSTPKFSVTYSKAVTIKFYLANLYIGEYTGVMLNGLAILGDYKFTNGESYHIAPACMRNPVLEPLISELRYSPKAQEFKERYLMAKYDYMMNTELYKDSAYERSRGNAGVSFDMDSAYTYGGGSSLTSDSGCTIPILHKLSDKDYNLNMLTKIKTNMECKDGLPIVDFAPDPMSSCNKVAIPLLGGKVPLAYSVTPVTIDYLLDGLSYMKYVGRIVKYDQFGSISYLPVDGEYTLANGEKHRISSCLDTDPGPKVEIKNEIVARSASGRRAAKADADQGKQRMKEKEQDKAKLEKYRHDAKVGMKVRYWVSSYHGQGIITDTRKDSVKVKFSEQVLKGLWHKVVPTEQWVERSKITYPENPVYDSKGVQL